MKSLVLPALVLLALSPVAEAAVTKTVKAKPLVKPTSNALTPAELSAKAPLDKMLALLKTSTGISYTATISTTSPTAPGAVPQQSDSNVTDEKNGKIAMTLNSGGTEQRVFCDGKNASLFDTGLGKYTISPAGSSLMASIISVLRASTSLYPKATSALYNLQMAMTFPMYYDMGKFDLLASPLPSGYVVSVTCKSNVLNNTPVKVVTESLTFHKVTVSFAYSIDPTTNLPAGFDMTYAMPGGKTSVGLHEVFSNFQLLTSPAVATTYAFVPPTGAMLVAAAPAAATPPAPQLLAAGTVAPDFTVTSEDNKPVKLSDFKGKVVVLDFWATWCPPCQASLPHTDAIAKAWEPKGVVFLPICTSDTEDNFKSWLKTHKDMGMQFYFDPAGQSDSNISAKLYGVEGIPTQYVIGADGKVQTSFVGYDEQGDPHEQALNLALKKATTTP